MTRSLTLVVALLAAAALCTAAAQDKQDNPQEPPVATTKPAAPQPAEQAHMYVKLETSLGDIVLDLDAEKAPISVKNFIDYVDSGFYAGTIFHRVMSNFMIQGGGFTSDLSEKKDGLRPPIKNEWQNGLKNTRGTIAMARTQIADSATAQFFINVVDNGMLDQPRDGAAYAVFGKVIGGMDVVDKIRATEVKEDPKLPMGKVVPATPVVIKSAKRLGADEGKTLARQADETAAKAASDAKAAGEKQLQDVLKKIEAETGKKPEKTASGLMYVILKEGSGASPKPTDTVEVHYTGTLPDGKKFDSSVDRGQPAVFPLNRVIKGWTEGVGLMKVGEKRKLIIPPDLAYGAVSPPGSGIPANSWLIFDVELLSIKGQ